MSSSHTEENGTAEGAHRKKDAEDNSPEKTSPSSSSEDSDNEGSHAQKKYTSVRAVGIAFDRNARFRRTMEDEHIILDSFGGTPTQGYFAIYDGHGGRGAVDFTAKHLHKNLELELQKNPPPEPLHAIRTAYLDTDKQLGESQVQFSGTTAVSALLRVEGSDRFLYSANAGDARAVLVRSGGKALRLTYDHKGSDESETKRIVDAGGFVALNRVNGVLAVTRSLGDHLMKDYVIADPYLQATKLEPGDNHLVLACDGLWDVASDQDVADLIVGESDAQKAADKLLVHALKNGSTDNISVMTIFL